MFLYSFANILSQLNSNLALKHCIFNGRCFNESIFFTYFEGIVTKLDFKFDTINNRGCKLIKMLPYPSNLNVELEGRISIYLYYNTIIT